MSIENEDGDVTILNTLGPGKYFGEVALVTEQERTATIMALTRSVFLSISQAAFSSFFKRYPECFADFELKLLKRECRIRSVIYHRSGHRFLAQHLAKEYSSENIDFWDDVQRFKKDPSMLLAQKIVSTYVADNAPQQVNISALQRHAIIDLMDVADVRMDMFDEAQDEVSSHLLGSNGL